MCLCLRAGSLNHIPQLYRHACGVDPVLMRGLSSELGIDKVLLTVRACEYQEKFSGGNLCRRHRIRMAWK